MFNNLYGCRISFLKSEKIERKISGKGYLLRLFQNNLLPLHSLSGKYSVGATP